MFVVVFVDRAAAHVCFGFIVMSFIYDGSLYAAPSPLSSLLCVSRVAPVASVAACLSACLSVFGYVSYVCLSLLLVASVWVTWHAAYLLQWQS